MPTDQMPNTLKFRDTRSISQRIEEKRKEITKDYLTDPNKNGLIEKLAIKYNVPRASLSVMISKWGLARSRNVAELVAKAVPIRKTMMKMAKELAVNSTLHDVQGMLEKFVKDHESSMKGHIDKIHEHIVQHAETKPMDLDDRIRYIEGVDRIARKLYGMKESEEVDPSKRGIALLAYGFQPQALSSSPFHTLPQIDAQIVGPDPLDLEELSDEDSLDPEDDDEDPE